MVARMRDDTHFGFREVPLGEKQALVDDVFHKVARRYDLMNDLMSAGLHRAWKDALVTAINPPTNPTGDFALLDVAGGTGDVSFRTIAAGGAARARSSPDINADMLGVGRERACCAGPRLMRSRSSTANAEALAVPGQELRRDFDRVRHPQRAAHRQSRCRRCNACCGIGGRFLCLEFSNVDVPGLDALYELYSFKHRAGDRRAVVGDAEPIATWSSRSARFRAPTPSPR
jgi:demethylmenaquinone methyltransferase/2-methoxy-6-polyprenyl-1,4-benzoquinol methylase